MIALVRIALRRPYTFVVLALVILIVGPLAALRTPVDIFPDIRIPVVAIVWQYTGLPPADMAGRITTPSARGRHAATDPQLQRIDRSDHSARAVRLGAVRADARRPRPQHRSDSPRYSSR